MEICYKECPENTYNDNNICKITQNDKCILGINDLVLKENDNFNVINVLVKNYINEFHYTNNFVTNYENNEYNILIYKTSSCINELSLEIGKIDFGNCYENVKKKYGIEENLITVVIKSKDRNNPSSYYSFYHPKSGLKLDSESICKEETIIVKENLLNLLDKNSSNYDSYIFLTDQNIYIFNISDDFYTDICYEYISPYDKDVSLKDRVKVFYPNVSICDIDCECEGINVTDMRAICNCKYNDISQKGSINDKSITNEVFKDVIDVINDSNLSVMKCFDKIFKYFNRSYGGYITLSLIVAHSSLSGIFLVFKLIWVKRYVFELIENFLKYLNVKPNCQREPNKKGKKVSFVENESDNKIKKNKNNNKKNVKVKG